MSCPTSLKLPASGSHQPACPALRRRTKSRRWHLKMIVLEVVNVDTVTGTVTERRYGNGLSANNALSRHELTLLPDGVTVLGRQASHYDSESRVKRDRLNSASRLKRSSWP